MASKLQVALPWHEGEVEMHRRLGVPDHDNPTSTLLSPKGAITLEQAPLLAIGTLDSENRPWVTLWGGQSGFCRPLSGNVVGLKTLVDDEYDPVVQALCGGRNDRSSTVQKNSGKLIGGLSVDLDRRNRVKLSGRMIASAIAMSEVEQSGDVQLVLRIEQSLGNCPKYINRRSIERGTLQPKLKFDMPYLPADGLEIIRQADLFFISTSNANLDMDVNLRGGVGGFTRTQKNSDGQFDIIWPEYSGNRFYQTLGNLKTTPLAGLVFPNFETGDVLYVTGHASILIGPEADDLIPHSNLAVKLSVRAAKFIQQSLPFRGMFVEPSPYNPKLRPLVTEREHNVGDFEMSSNSVILREQTPLSPTISRFRFSLSQPASYKPGQWVALDFSNDLKKDYRHMNDDDPRSLNDDYVRTFTVSSPPPPGVSRANDEFEITARKVGTVTNFLFRHQGVHQLQIPLRGFGGDFRIKQDELTSTPFVAGGVGITPILGLLPSLNVARLKLYWTLHFEDLNLVKDTFKRYPDLAGSSTLFLTGNADRIEMQSAISDLRRFGAVAESRHLCEEDLRQPLRTLSDRWYLCVGTKLRKTLLGWLRDKEVYFEDFNF